MPFHAAPLSLSEDAHQELQRMSLSRSLPAGDVFRARLILMLDEGRSYTEVQKRLNITAPTISKWRKRFLEQRIYGLIARGIFTSVKDLARKLMRYSQAYSASAKPFRMKYSNVQRRITC